MNFKLGMCYNFLETNIRRYLKTSQTFPKTLHGNTNFIYDTIVKKCSNCINYLTLVSRMKQCKLQEVFCT